MLPGISLHMLPSRDLTQHVAARNGGGGGGRSDTVPEDEPHTWGCESGLGRIGKFSLIQNSLTHSYLLF